jgi:hypothetical protein
MGILCSKTSAEDAPDFQSAEAYVHIILECYHGIVNLYPLERDEKIEKEVMPVFRKLYGVIAHTTVDPKTEHLVYRSLLSERSSTLALMSHRF